MEGGNGPDWDAIRRELEEGEGTLGEIADRHGVARGTVSMRKLRGGWVSLKDAERMAKMDEAMAQLAEDLSARLKRHSREAAALEKAVKARPLGELDDAGLEARRRLNEGVAKGLSATVALAAGYQRMLERRARSSARFAAPLQENPLERPEFIEVERAILARLAEAGIEGRMGGTD